MSEFTHLMFICSPWDLQKYIFKMKIVTVAVDRLSNYHNLILCEMRV